MKNDKGLELLNLWWFAKITDEKFYSEMRQLMGDPTIFKRYTDVTTPSEVPNGQAQ